MVYDELPFGFFIGILTSHVSLCAPEPQFVYLRNGAMIAQDCTRAKWVKSS